MLQLGHRMRVEYLPQLHSLDPDHAVIKSSFLDRTQTSAELFSRAFFLNDHDHNEVKAAAPIQVLTLQEDNVRVNFLR